MTIFPERAVLLYKRNIDLSECPVEWTKAIQEIMRHKSLSFEELEDIRKVRLVIAPESKERGLHYDDFTSLQRLEAALDDVQISALAIRLEQYFAFPAYIIHYCV